jgi:Uma2 family endonuclease
MVAAKQFLTEAEFAEIDSPGRHDLVDGELWSRPPAQIPHGRYATRIILALGRFVEHPGIGEVLSGEIGYVLTVDRRTILCPDVAFVRSDRVPANEERGFFNGAPDLAVEVISPSERPQQIQTNVARYLSAGTTLVWCVYPELQQIVVYHHDLPPHILSVSDTLTADPVITGFQLPLRELFRPI